MLIERGSRRGRSRSRVPGGLRDHQARHVAERADLDRPVPGHDRLRGAGADPGHLGAGAGRPVLAGVRAVRVPDRPGPVREGPGRGDHLGARRGDADDAHGAAADLPPQIDEVFAGCCPSGPDERYQSCREFIQAAQLALGIFGPGTASSPPYGVTATGPRGARQPPLPAGAVLLERPISQPSPPARPGRGSHPGARPPASPYGRAPTACSRPAGVNHELPDRLDPPSGPRRRARRLASRREQSTARRLRTGRTRPAGARLRRPGRPGRAAGTALVPPAALDRRAGRRDPAPAAWAPGPGLHGSGSHHRGGRAVRRRPRAEAKPVDERADGRVVLANKSADATGLIPPSTCKQGSPPS